MSTACKSWTVTHERMNRFHEAFTEPLEARVEQCFNSGPCSAPNVLRSTSRASVGSTPNSRKTTTVSETFLSISIRCSPFFVSLSLAVLRDYAKLRPDTQGKNIQAWAPVIAEIFDGFVRLDDKAVSQLPCFFFLCVVLRPAQLVQALPFCHLRSGNRTLGSRPNARDPKGPQRLLLARRRRLLEH